MIDIANLVEVIIAIMVKYRELSKSIINNNNLLFPLKFRFLFYYFFNIKQKLLTNF